MNQIYVSQKSCRNCHEQGTKRAKFDETVDLRLILGTDPRRGDQAVRGTAMLPHGTGRVVRVAAFVEPEDAAAALAAGEMANLTYALLRDACECMRAGSTS